MTTWRKAGTVKKNGHWFYQLYNADTNQTVLKPCPNLDAKSKPTTSKSERKAEQKAQRKAERRERQKAVEYALHHKGKKSSKKSDGKPKKPKDPWAKEIRKARKGLAKSHRSTGTSRSYYNGSRGMHSHSTKL